MTSAPGFARGTLEQLGETSPRGVATSKRSIDAWEAWGGRRVNSGSPHWADGRDVRLVVGATQYFGMVVCTNCRKLVLLRGFVCLCLGCVDCLNS